MPVLVFAFLVSAFSADAFGQTATVIAENANLRGTLTEKGKIVKTLKRDTQVEVLKQRSAWFLVQSADYVGWIHGNTIKLSGTIETIQNAESNVTPGSALTPRQLIDIPRRATSTSQRPPGSYPPLPSSPSRTYFRGPRGGCYYINSSGKKKTYVDHSFCN